MNTVTSATGKVGNAASFASANSEQLTITDNADLSMGDIDFTIAAWVYFDVAANRSIVTKWTREYALWYGVFAANRFDFSVSHDGSGRTTVVANNFGAASANTWYFVVAWHDATANTINICVNDGTPDSASHTTGVHDGGATFRIGNWSAGAFMNGIIDEVGIWKRVLTSSEITELYNGGNGRDYAYISGGAATGQPITARRRGTTEPMGARRIGRGW